MSYSVLASGQGARRDRPYASHHRSYQDLCGFVFFRAQLSHPANPPKSKNFSVRALSCLTT